MTKDTGDLTQFHAVACREYTEEQASQPKGWIQGNTKIGPVLEVATSYLHGKDGVEIGMMSYEQRQFSFMGLHKLVTNLNNKESSSEDENLPAFHKNFNNWGESLFGQMLNQENIQSPITKCRRNLRIFCHGSLHREDHGAIEFCRIKENFQDRRQVKGAQWQKEEETKRSQYCIDSSGQEFFISQFFMAIQDAVSLILFYRTTLLIRANSSSTFFISDVQSIYIPSKNSGLISGGQNLSNRQTVFLCLWIPWTKTIRILTRSIWEHRVMHNSCTKHGRNIKMRCIGLTSILFFKKGFTFYQSRSNAIILHETLPACCVPKVVRMEIGEVISEIVFASRRPLPKISLTHNWMKELGSEVVRQPEGLVVQQLFPVNLTKPKFKS